MPPHNNRWTMEDLHFFGIHIFYYLIVVAFLLPKVPVVGKFFNIINTLIHELGHVLMALVFEGKVVRIEIFKDTGGVTVTKSKSGVAAFFVSIAGYPFAAAAGLLCAYLLSLGYGSWIVIGLSILFLFMLLLWVRNGYGALWVILFCLLNGVLVFYLKNPLYIEIAAWFYTLMIVIESVWSSLVLLYLSIFHADQSGDAANLRNETHIPAFVWALLFVVFSGWMAYCSAAVVNGMVKL